MAGDYRSEPASGEPSVSSSLRFGPTVQDGSKLRAHAHMVIVRVDIEVYDNHDSAHSDLSCLNLLTAFPIPL